MRFNPLIVLSIVLATGLAGCYTQRENIAWPPPRPLGHDIPVFRPPATPEERVETHPSLKEPRGEMTLRKAVALAVADLERLIGESISAELINADEKMADEKKKEEDSQ